MQLDSTLCIFYNDMINIIEVNMSRIFGVDVKKTEKICKFENRGYFKLTYDYAPSNYKIIIENEIRTFDITIIDSDKASNSLYRISKYKNQLNEENIEEAISLLKAVLEKNDFNLYFHKEGKLYRKNPEGVKRVKDIKELMNG